MHALRSSVCSIPFAAFLTGVAAMMTAYANDPGYVLHAADITQLHRGTAALNSPFEKSGRG